MLKVSRHAATRRQVLKWGTAIGASGIVTMARGQGQFPSRPIRLKVDRSQMEGASSSAVLVLKDDVGTLLRIHVTADVP